MLQNLFFSAPKTQYKDDIIDVLRLIRSENVGPKTFFNLVKMFGNATIALENIADFSIRGGKTKPIKIFSRADAEAEINLLYQNNAKIISYTDPNYSKLLLEIPDPPPILTYKGNLHLLNHNKCVGIVGSRNASINGKTFAAKIARDLQLQGYTTVSGLARGIDTAVHQASLTSTIAVIAGGIDHIYPPENTKLYHEIIEQGLLITELPINTKPLGQHFPQRNRIISGISRGVVVIEATIKSGSLITAQAALEQNREIFSVPGFPLDPRHQGTNQLIKDGAHLVQSTEDIITNLPEYHQLFNKITDSSDTNNNFNNHTIQNIYISDIERQSILNLLSATPINFEEILYESKLSIQAVYTIILELELAGRITRYPGNKIALVYKYN